MNKKLRTIHFSSSKSAAVRPEEQRDINSSRGNVQRQVNAGSKKFDLYPWGENNLLPNERIKLLRTNGDAGNLIEARADFLFGGGFGFFKHVNKGGIITREPFTNPAIDQYTDAYGMDDLGDVANAMCTSLIETGNVFINRSLVDGLPIYSVKDSLICRSTVATGKKLPTYLLNPDWSQHEMQRNNTIPVPSFDFTDKLTESIIHLRPYQSGQSYYGFAQYWGEETVMWIEVMNFIAKSIGQTVRHNKNIAHICRVATSYFDQMVASSVSDEIDDSYDPEKEKNKVRSDFYANVEKMIESEDGPRIIFDECDMGGDGKMAGMIAFEEIKRSLDAGQLEEAYNVALRAFANASRMLPSLAGVSDGKTLGGTGSELKVSANYQQFYRTPRERSLILKPFNRDVKKALKLPSDVFAGFFDVLLVSDDKNPAGKETKAGQDAGQKGSEKQDANKSKPKPKNAA